MSDDDTTENTTGGDESVDTPSAGSATGPAQGRRRTRTTAVYVISVAAELAGMHPQTLRIYERRGLVSPARTQGGNRRYSDDDIERLRRIAELTSEGMNLEGIRRVMALEAENARLRTELEQAREIAVHAIREAEKRPARSGGDLVPLKQAVAVFGQRPSIFDRD